MKTKSSKEAKKKSEVKPTTKKVSKLENKKPMTQKFCENVSEDKKFLVANGEILSNLFDLIHLLDNIDDYTFYHHVNDEKNDFYNWIKEMYGDGEFEKIILPIRNPEKLEIALLKYIVNTLSKCNKLNL